MVEQLRGYQSRGKGASMIEQSRHRSGWLRKSEPEEPKLILRYSNSLPKESPSLQGRVVDTRFCNSICLVFRLEHKQKGAHAITTKEHDLQTKHLNSGVVLG